VARALRRWRRTRKTMRKVRTPKATNAPITAPAIAPVFEDLSCCIVVDPWVTPPSPEEPEADNPPDEDTVEEDVNVGVMLGEEIAEDGLEVEVDLGPAVILNSGLSARAAWLSVTLRARRLYPVLSNAVIKRD
jgi:hypothetical protein